eukprot:scaffold39835_cov65-Phaeocystis_antarctica.AAC.1
MAAWSWRVSYPAVERLLGGPEAYGGVDHVRRLPFFMLQYACRQRPGHATPRNQRPKSTHRRSAPQSR